MDGAFSIQRSAISQDLVFIVFCPAFRRTESGLLIERPSSRIACRSEAEIPQIEATEAGNLKKLVMDEHQVKNWHCLRRFFI